jgi:glycine oxidase
MKILVVGQGIAGGMLAWTLHHRGAQVHIADAGLPGGSSAVAAGILNPITGKRFVKSWRYDEFYQTAESTYRSVGTSLGISIWTEQPMLRLLGSAEEANNWSARCALADYADHMAEPQNAGSWAPYIRPGFHIGLIKKAARVHFDLLLDAWRKWAQQEGLFSNKVIDYPEIEKLSAAYDAIVCCEGYRGGDNPYFPDLPWQIAKGEALLIRLASPPGAVLGEMLKKTMTLVPYGSNLFWAGGSYQWHYPDLKPSAGERDYIVHHLNEMLAVPFEIAGHHAGVRPTVKDRRPLLGQSSLNDKVFLFNGMGTKGALLAPYWAAHFSDYLIGGKALDAEVDIRRVRGA